ncbi:MAG: tRNA (adenosine(37)-N6)-threonylcarbamoyltransferase complex dimerization subunit type 1 TsaB [Enterobacteriaceae bacterium]
MCKIKYNKNFKKCILSLDTSTKNCSVSLISKKKIFFRKIKSKYSTNNILFMIESILKESNIKFNNINSIAFNIGPGSFTGIRIGSLISKSFNFAYKIPIIGITSILIISENIKRKTNKKNIIIFEEFNKKKKIFITNFSKKKKWRLLKTFKIDENKKNFIDKIIKSLPKNNFLAIGSFLYKKKYIKIFKKYKNIKIMTNKKFETNAYDMLNIAIYKFLDKDFQNNKNPKLIYLPKNKWKKLI